MITITNNDGSVGHVWLEGTALSHDLAKMRFRLTVGTAGGLICDRVEAAPGLRRKDRILLAARVAREADPRRTPGLPFVDEAGCKAAIQSDDDLGEEERSGEIERMTDAELSKVEPLPWFVDGRLVYAIIGFTCLIMAAFVYARYGSSLAAVLAALVPPLLFHSHVRSLGIMEQDARKAQHALERGVAQEMERRQAAAALA